MTAELKKPRNIGLFTAHPDDNTLAIFLLLKNKEIGGKNFELCMTRGGRGNGNLPEYLKHIDEKELKKTREEEIRKFWKHMKMSGEIMDYPDGELYFCKNLLKKEIEKNIEKKVKQKNINLLVTFDETGYTGHGDHIALYQMTKNVAKKMKIEMWTISRPPQEVCPKFYHSIKNKRKKGVYISSPKENSSKKYDLIISGQKREKLKGIKYYQTQLNGILAHMFAEPEEAKHISENEYYRLEKNNQK